MLSSRTETLQLVLAAHLDHSDVRADYRGAGGGLFTAGEIGPSPAALAARGVSTEHGRRRQRRQQSIYVRMLYWTKWMKERVRRKLAKRIMRGEASDAAAAVY
jgi:hypothetical protein